MDQVEVFFDKNPCNFRRSKHPAGSKQFFRDIEENKHHVEPHIPAFAAWSQWQGKRVLDLGCGLGSESVNFARAGATVVAVDLSSVSLKWLRQRCEHEGLLNQVTLVCGNYEKLDELLDPALMGSFDLVWAFGSFHHTSTPQRAMQQAFSALKSGGTLRAMVYSRVSWKRFDLLHQHGPWTLGREGDSTVAWHSEASYGSPITHSFSLNEAKELAIEAGFNSINVRKAHIFRYDIEAYNEGRYELAPEWTNVSEADVRDLEEELGWHTLISANKE